jgi:hypothetical protein
LAEFLCVVYALRFSWVILDHILIVYNETNTDINDLLNRFNIVSPKLNFTVEKETNHKINFLNVTITRDPKKLSVNIYRKPTYTDAIIPRDSCHPKEQKLMAIRYLLNRMNSYQLSPENSDKEKNTVEQILHNNG